MPEWLTAYPEVLAAASTVLLAVFAAVQIGLEMHRGRQAGRAAQVEAKGPAWLARRTLEQALMIAEEVDEPRQWAWLTDRSDGLDRVEAQMLEVIRLGGASPGRITNAAELAFEHFLGYADGVNALRAFEGSEPDGRGGLRTTSEDEDRLRTVGNLALDHLAQAIEQLEVLAPRRAHEPAPEKPEVVRFIEPGENEQRKLAARDGR